MSMIKKLLTFFHGFCMALADSVPGVSGGTVAFLMGFYDDFIGSIDSLIVGPMEKRKKGFLYLVKLGIGWAIGFGLAVTILASVFESGIYIVSSLFMGFIIFAIPVVVYEEWDCFKSGIKKLFWLIPGIALVVGITVLTSLSESTTDITNPTVLTYVYVFFAGAVAICAMVLPGISGSTLLLVFGLYLPIITAVKDVLHFTSFSEIPILIVFALGIVVGIVSIVRLIKTALEKHRAAMLYLIVGMMLGSMYSIVMGPTTLEIPQAPMSFGNFSIIAFIAGGLVIAGMEFMRRRTEKHRPDIDDK